MIKTVQAGQGRARQDSFNELKAMTRHFYSDIHYTQQARDFCLLRFKGIFPKKIFFPKMLVTRIGVVSVVVLV